MVSATLTRKRATSTASSTSPAGKKIEKVGSRMSISSVTSSTTTDDKTPRKHLTSVLGISISQARCDKYLKSVINDPADVSILRDLKTYFGTNALLKEKVEALEDELTGIRREEKTADDASRKDLTKRSGEITKQLGSSELKEMVSKLKEHREVVKRVIRLSKDVPIALATAGDYIVTDLIMFAMDYVLDKTKNRTVEIRHLFADGYDKTKVYQIVHGLKTFSDYEKTKDQEKSKPAPVEEEEDEQPDTTGSESEADSNAIVLDRYVHNLIDKIKKDEKVTKYKNIRVSKAVKKFMSNLIIDFLDKIAVYSNVIVHNITFVRTLTSSHITNIIRLILSNKIAENEVFNEINTNINSKIELFKQHNSTKPDTAVATP